MPSSQRSARRHLGAPLSVWARLRPNAHRLDKPPVRYAESWLALGRRVAYCAVSRSGQRLAGTLTFSRRSHTSGHCLLRGVLQATGQRLQGASRSPSASIFCAASRANIASISDALSSKLCLAHVVLRIPLQHLLHGLSRKPARSFMRSFSCAPTWRLVRHRVASHSPLGRVSCAVFRTPPDSVSLAASHALQDVVRLPWHLERGVISFVASRTRWRLSCGAPYRHIASGVSCVSGRFLPSPRSSFCV